MSVLFDIFAGLRYFCASMLPRSVGFRNRMAVAYLVQGLANRSRASLPRMSQFKLLPLLFTL